MKKETREEKIAKGHEDDEMLVSRYLNGSDLIRIQLQSVSNGHLFPLLGDSLRIFITH